MAAAAHSSTNVDAAIPSSLFAISPCGRADRGGTKNRRRAFWCGPIEPGRLLWVAEFFSGCWAFRYRSSSSSRCFTGR
jgi:hypothetical protein